MTVNAPSAFPSYEPGSKTDHPPRQPVPAWPVKGPGHFKEPFAPVGVTFYPVQRRLARARLLIAAMLLVPCYCAGIAVMIFTPLAVLAGIVLVALLAMTVWLGWLIPRQVSALGFAERDDDLLIRRGVMFKKMVVVPYGRLQFVDVDMGPIARIMNIAAVKLHTASPGTDAHIPGLDPLDAERLRDNLTLRGEARLAGL